MLNKNRAEPEDIHITVGDLQFALQSWGEPGQFPVLALHGWLDNSASFTRLAPLIENAHILAPDLAGHGHSSHRARFSPYNIWQDVGEVFAIADQMGWEKFALIGHSRGAIIAMLASGTFPERISHLGLIDGFWPETVSAADAPAQLARSIRDLAQQEERNFPVYRDLEAAIKVRVNVRFALSDEAARAIVERGVKRVSGGYTWSADPQLLAASAVKLTQEQVEAFIKRITAPTKLVLAKNGPLTQFAHFADSLNRSPQTGVEMLSGGHHLHMEAESLKIAALFNGLFAGK